MDTYTLIIAVFAFAAFWALIFMAKRYLPKSFEIRPPYPYIMWRTAKFNNFIDRVGTSAKFAWKVAGNLGIAISVGGLIYIFYLLAQNLFLLLTKPKAASPVSLLIPGVTISLDLNTLFFIGASIAIIIIFHELAHGVAARAEGIAVKNTGLLVAAIIPGAFVEPDEEGLRKAKKSTQARVYAAGSTTNIVMALLVLGLVVNTTAILSPFYETNVQIVGVAAGSPADGILKAGDLILSINGSSITDLQSLSSTLSNTRPNSTVPFTILRGNETDQLQFKLGYSNTTNSSYIGVNIQNYYQPKSPFYSAAFPFYFTGLTSWLYLLSLNIGLINLLPVFVFDGGRFANILARFALRNEKRADQISNILQFASLGILVLNISLSFVFFPGFKFG